MESISLIGLCKIELPSHDVLLCGGGFMLFDGETYRDVDYLLGTIGSIQSLGEGTGPEVPALELVFLPPGNITPGQLVQPGWQTSRARFWIAEYDPTTGLITVPPDRPEFLGQLDQSSLSVGLTRELAVTVVALVERLIAQNTGNSLTSAWHKSIHPGELGHDNATGLAVQVAWGTTNPPSSGATTPGSQYRVPARTPIESYA